MPVSDLFVVTKLDSIKRFCVQIGIDHLFLESETDLSLPGLNRYKEYLKGIAKTFTGEAFCFCHYGFDITGLYLMGLLQKNNEVYFENKDHFLHPLAGGWILNIFNRNYRRILFRRTIWTYVLRKRFKIFEIRRGNWFLGILPRTLESRFKKMPVKPEESEKLIFKENQELILRKFQIDEFDILFIDDGGANIYSTDKIQSILIDLKNAGYRLAIKLHPNFEATFDHDDFYKIPKYVPAELVCTLSKVATVGVISSALLISSTFSPVFSLAEMVRFESEVEKKAITDLFSHYQIVYPKTTEELVQLLN